MSYFLTLDLPEVYINEALYEVCIVSKKFEIQADSIIDIVSIR
jgi:hypothetical protein